MAKDKIIKDSIRGGWVERMPESMRPYLRLSRLDRPIGFWLLALPGWIGLAFAGLLQGFVQADIKWAALILIGAVAMRGAGCTYNDIVDRDLDAQVDRTTLRPIPAGTVSLKQAWLWLGAQCFVGLVVLLFFPRLAQIIALCSILLVGIYPFMKRVTYWPQAWLGLTFNWAVLVAYAAKTGAVSPQIGILYGGLIFWTIGYDTIYACQDTEDDALIGVKSTARLFGARVKLGVGLCYALCLFLFSIAAMPALSTGTIKTLFPEYRLWLWIMPVTLLPFAAHLAWQIKSFNPDISASCLRVFKSNRAAALLLILPWAAIALLI